MKLRLPPRSPVFAAVAVAASTVAHAHPGHDGHDFTWDLSVSGVAHFAWHAMPYVAGVIVLMGVGFAVRRGLQRRATRVAPRHTQA